MPQNNQGFHSEGYLNWFDKHGKARPWHGEWNEDEIEKNMKKLKPNTWKLEGNKLSGETELGMLVNYIPTDYILKGTDENGLPILEKVVL
jgi:hypothetical protein